jgi:putative resolvase
VSSAGQKDDLAAQVTAMERFCLARGLSVDEWLTEIGGGMNLTRRTFVAVMDAIERGEIATLVIAHQDRVARFGFDYLEHVATKNDCDIVVANQQSLSRRRPGPLDRGHRASRQIV